MSSSSSSVVSVSGSKMNNNQKEKDFLEQLKEIQKMEKQTKNTLEMFMNTLNQRTTSEDCASLLLEKIEQLRKVESMLENKNIEITQLNTEVTILNEKYEQSIVANKKHVDEQISLQNLLAESDKVIRKIESQMLMQQKNQQLDLEQKSSSLKSLEEEYTTLKVHYNELESRLESNNVETSELHVAMAGLHGEISILQSELDDAKEKEKEIIRQRKDTLQRLEVKEEIILKSQSEKSFLQNKIIDLERKLHEFSDKNAMIQQESHYKVDNLVRERDSVQGSLAKMGNKIKQQNQTLQELNSLLTRMKADLSTAIDARDLAESRAMASEKALADVRAVASSLDHSNIENEKLYLRSQQEARLLSSDITQLKEKNATLLAENRKASARIDKLERDKYDMAIDITNKTKDMDVMKSNLEATNNTMTDIQNKYEHDKMLKDRALEEKSILESELERFRFDNRENQENIEAMARQLREGERMREQSLEVSRAQQRENANRIVEFSQKNAKLSSELSSLKDELSSYKRTKDEVNQDLRDAYKERDDAKTQYTSIRVRLQTLEDQYEEANAKLESRKAELDEVRSELKRETQSKETAITNIKQEHEKQLVSAIKALEAEYEEKATSAMQLRNQAEQNYDKTLQKAKEVHQQQIEELQLQRQRDASEAKAKMSTIAKAMESLQSELRDETNKSKALMQELNVVKDLVEVGSTEAHERLHYVERERLRDRARLDGQLTDVKEQLRQQSEQKQQRDQLMATIEQQLGRERDARFLAMQKIRTLEDETGTLSSQLDSVNEENATLRKQLRDHERKLSAAVQGKDAELQRLTRRNEVLGEAVTRLTSSQSTGSATTAVGKFFTSYDNTSSILDNYEYHNGSVDDNDLEPYHSSSSSIGMNVVRPKSGTSMTATSSTDGDDAKKSLPRAQSAPSTRRFDRRLQQNRYNSVDGNDDDDDSSSSDRRGDGDYLHATDRVDDAVVNDTNSELVDHVQSLKLSLDIDNFTPVVTPPASARNSNQSTNSEGATNSGSMFALKVRQSVDVGKDHLLPYSPTPKWNKPAMLNQSPDSADVALQHQHPTSVTATPPRPPVSPVSKASIAASPVASPIASEMNSILEMKLGSDITDLLHNDSPASTEMAGVVAETAAVSVTTPPRRAVTAKVKTKSPAESNTVREVKSLLAGKSKAILNKKSK